MTKLLSSIFILLCLTVHSQKMTGTFNYKASYELGHQVDSTDIDSKKSETMVLYLGDQYSMFSSLGHAVEDSLMHYRDRSNKSMAAFSRIRAQIPNTEFNYKIFKDHTNQEIWFVEKFFKDKIKYQEELKPQNWQIHPETDTIAGYRAQKATTRFRGRNYTAWFTPEIPVPEGPYKFSGLPGLIVEVFDDQKHYHFKLKGFQELKPGVSQIIKEKDYLEMDKSEFSKIRDNFKRDPLSVMRSGGLKIHWSDEREMEAKKEFRERFKKENNPIELEN
ncbi:GLPGLI family protein [Gramella sp. GC03-9]|uniref:GLPGLI family protein n=1 Tax=Christiangramia oceanisediminis TaxID=2920386 RepID=A0A9X2I0A3_9FLAO|nr:GLPGLI family protein [Gramella oceanisediminis]MCP9198904.1 GLPGLI family protein [Gramella oceanisediminis]